MPTFPRIRPYKTYAVSDDGSRTLVPAHEIVLERPQGIDLEINLAPHPSFRGRLSFSTFRGSSLLLEAGSSAHAYVFVEDWPVGDRRRKASHRYSRSPVGHVYLVDARGKKTGTDARTFAIQTSERHELHLELCPSKPWARHVEIESSTGLLTIHLNASNVVQFAVEDLRRGGAG